MVRWKDVTSEGWALHLVLWRGVTHVLFWSRVGSSVRHTSPRVGAILFRLWVAYTRVHFDVFRLLGSDRYTDLDPFRTYYVDPSEILCGDPRPPRLPGVVDAGDWDRNTSPFVESNPVARSIADHFVRDVPWDQTPLRDEFVHLIETTGDAWGYDSPGAFDRRCADIERFYRDVDSHGYRSQRALLEQDFERAVREMDGEDVHPLMNEVGVSIGRDGDLVWTARGNHRLAIAIILGVESIPIRIVARHAGWQEKRETRGYPPETSIHPSLMERPADGGQRAADRGW